MLFICRVYVKITSTSVKSRMISAPTLLILNMEHEAEFVFVIDASKVGIAGVL